VGIPAASLCIFRRLYLIASIKSVTITKAEKRRAIMVDLAISLGIPLLQMILRVYNDVSNSQSNLITLLPEYVVQGHRYNIYEDIGCFPATYNTPMAYPLVFAWPIVIGLISSVYCCKYIFAALVCQRYTYSFVVMTIRSLAIRRSEFNQLLSGNNNLNSSRYFRLMGLACVELLLSIPWACYVCLYLNLHAKVYPWKGWADTHLHFSLVRQTAAVQWKSNHVGMITLEMSRWASVICAFIFFGFFGFADEARKNYRLAFYSVAKKVGFTTINQSSGTSSSFGGSKQMTSTSGRASLPVFVRHEIVSKRDSFNSFSTNITIDDVGGALDDFKPPYSPTESSTGSSRYNYDEKHEVPVVSRPESTFDPASVPPYSAHPSAPARPDSTTLV
jgi:pheromone a factor receptor